MMRIDTTARAEIVLGCFGIELIHRKKLLTLDDSDPTKRYGRLEPDGSDTSNFTAHSGTKPDELASRQCDP